jgi:hypothetical protein
MKTRICQQPEADDPTLKMVWEAKQEVWDEVEKATKGKPLSEKFYCLSIGVKNYLKEKEKKFLKP